MHSNKRVALVTFSGIQDRDVDTPQVVAALQALHVRPEVVCWDQPVDWTEFALVVIRSPWNYYMHLSDFLDWARHVSELCPMLNPFPIIEWNCHKRYLIELEHAGVPIIPTRMIERHSVEPMASLRTTNWTEVVIKPAVSAGAVGALRTRLDHLDCAEHLRSITMDNDALVQPFMHSVTTTGETSLMFFDGQFSHAVCKRPQVGDYRVQDQHGGTVQPHEPSRAEMDVAMLALRTAPGSTTYARVDLVHRNKQPALMELELIEPALFLAFSANATQRYSQALLAKLG